MTNRIVYYIALVGLLQIDVDAVIGNDSSIIKSYILIF